MLPVVPVSKQTDYFPVWSRADANKVIDGAIGPRDMPGEIYQSLSKGQYKVQARAWWSPVSNDLLATSDSPLDLMGQASRDVRGVYAKSRELRAATTIMTAANYTYNTALSSTNRWDVAAGTSTADPIADILINANLSAVPPNTIVMSKSVWTYFRKHPKVVSSVAGVGIGGDQEPRVASTKAVEALLGMRLLIGDAKYRTSADGAAETYDFIWGKGIALLYVEKGAGINTRCFAKTFRQTPLGFTTIYDQRPGMGGVTYVKGFHADAEQITAADMGAFIDTVIS